MELSMHPGYSLLISRELDPVDYQCIRQESKDFSPGERSPEWGNVAVLGRSDKGVLIAGGTAYWSGSWGRIDAIWSSALPFSEEMASLIIHMLERELEKSRCQTAELSPTTEVGTRIAHRLGYTATENRIWSKSLTAGLRSA
jgi:hypothetical protein